MAVTTEFSRFEMLLISAARLKKVNKSSGVTGVYAIVRLTGDGAPRGEFTTPTATQNMRNPTWNLCAPFPYFPTTALERIHALVTVYGARPGGGDDTTIGHAYIPVKDLANLAAAAPGSPPVLKLKDGRDWAGDLYVSFSFSKPLGLPATAVNTLLSPPDAHLRSVVEGNITTRDGGVLLSSVVNVTNNYYTVHPAPQPKALNRPEHWMGIPNAFSWAVKLIPSILLKILGAPSV